MIGNMFQQNKNNGVYECENYYKYKIYVAQFMCIYKEHNCI